jgi:DNA-directed RNA polymerase omega subunit
MGVTAAQANKRPKRNRQTISDKDLPFRNMAISHRVTEDVEKATWKYSGGNKNTSTGKYEMIITAAARAIDISLGSKPLLNSIHKPAVTALLEIEAGLVGKDYLRQFNNPIHVKKH